MKPKVFIYLEGGMIQNVVSNQPIDFLILDGDIDGVNAREIHEYRSMHGSSFKAHPVLPVIGVDPEFIRHYFGQKEKKSEGQRVRKKS